MGIKLMSILNMKCARFFILFISLWFTVKSIHAEMIYTSKLPYGNIQQRKERIDFAVKWCDKFPNQKFNGTPQKIRIVSNSIGYGPCPEPNDIVEQHITINSDGRVWFSEYAFGDGFGKYKKAQTKNLFCLYELK